MFMGVHNIPGKLCSNVRRGFVGGEARFLTSRASLRPSVCECSCARSTSSTVADTRLDCVSVTFAHYVLLLLTWQTHLRQAYYTVDSSASSVYCSEGD